MMMKDYIVSNIFLAIHFLICLFGSRRNRWKQIPYFTDFIENFEFSFTRPFTILILTLIYSNVLFDKNVQENFQNFALSSDNLCLILNITTCIFVTGVLVHTFSEDAMSRKLHFIYAFIGITCGNSSVVVYILQSYYGSETKLSFYSLSIFFLFNIIATALLFKQYAYFNNIIFGNYVLPLCEHLYITSSIPIYFERHMNKFELHETYIKLFFVYFFVYFVSNTEIRRNPKYNTEMEFNHYSHLFYKRKRFARKCYHKLLVPIDIICIVFNLYYIDGQELENRFFENIHQDRLQQFCGVGGFEITIFEPKSVL